MKIVLTLSFALFVSLVFSQQNTLISKTLPATEVRKTISLNGEWEFKSNADSQWTKVRVPGSYTGLGQSWGGIHWDIWDYPTQWQGKGGEYRTVFSIPGDMQSKNLRIKFDGVIQHAVFFLNGKKIGETHDGYNPIEIDITPFVAGESNELRVVVADDGPWHSPDKGSHRGIWQDVWLNAYSDIVIEKEAFVKTSVRKGILSIDLPISNKGKKATDLYIRNYVTDKNGQLVLSFDRGWQKILPGKNPAVSCSAIWSTPHLWFPHDPYLYFITTVLYDKEGNLLDKKTIRFGFREISWDGPYMYLNGMKLFLRGDGGHSQGDIQGTREYLYAWLTNLKKYGVNFMRLHNDPKHQLIYEVADEVGMLLETETAFFFFMPKDTAFVYDHLSNLVLWTRNHPSVFLWSVSNELRWYGGGERKDLVDLVRKLDDTRPVFSSDFTIESKHGDIIAHHYNPETVFDEWKIYGPDKPMLWDEFGSVWQPYRPCYNGTAGYEIAAQDYATGMWRDGRDQILDDIEGMIDGQFFDGELHRITGYLPWDFSYTFFRWQPTNKNRDLPQKHPSLDGPGLKPKIIHSLPSTVNIWDPTLPVMEPNPGYWIFSKHFKEVRFFDKQKRTSFFAGEKINMSSRLYFEDLRTANILFCRIQDLNGRTITENRLTINIKPGDIVDPINTVFDIPRVKTPTAAWLVRHFYNNDIPGWKDSIPIRIFPTQERDLPTSLQGKKTGVWEKNNQISSMLAYLNIPHEKVSNGKNLSTFQILICDETVTSASLNNFVEKGGRVLQLHTAHPSTLQGYLPENTIIEKFETKHPATIMLRHVTSKNTGFKWAGWSEERALVRLESKDLVDQHGMLTFDLNTNKCSYAFTEFRDSANSYYLSKMQDGKLILEYIARIPEIMEGKDFPDSQLTHHFRLLLRDKAGEWYLSDTSNLIILKSKRESITINLHPFRWQKVCGRFVDVPRLCPGYTQPDLSEVTGAGLYLEGNPSALFGISILRFQLVGFSGPSAQIPLNGSPHKILSDIEQKELTNWTGGSCLSILELPDKGKNFRNILAGNKDGYGSALYEEYSGKGMKINTSLNIAGTYKNEPAAMHFIFNSLEYLAEVQLTPCKKTGVVASSSLPGWLGSIGLAFDPLSPELFPASLENYNCLILDGDDTGIANGLAASLEKIQQFVLNGGTVFVLKANEQTIGFFSKLTEKSLSLTAPFLGETKFCIKAPISWTLKDTPYQLAEYYEDILIPLSMEPNLDPILSGIANKDFYWEGTPMFTQGIEIKDMDPVDANNQYNILASNWRIDWSNSGGWSAWGEYTNAVKDVRQTYWFLNRDAVLLKINQGKGAVIFCQLDLPAGKEKSARLASQWFTALNCPFVNTYSLPSINQSYDMTLQNAQWKRFETIRKLLEPVKRNYYGASEEINRIAPVQYENPLYPD